jgi:uncharacterized protein RhaS with RHS repeats
MRTAAPGASRGYPHGGTAYANPDAVTQIANGLSTTTFSYDADGNVTQKTVDGTTTTYVYDYANRLTALGGCANNKKGYCRDFQVGGKESTISYDDPKETPRYLIINTQTGDERFYVQPQDASSSDQAIFQELRVKEN